MSAADEWAIVVSARINARIEQGQRFLGAIDGFRVVELVFDLPSKDTKYNLITIGPEGVRIGWVGAPEEYVRVAHRSSS